MLPGMAMAGAGAAVPIVLKSLSQAASSSAQFGGYVTLTGRTAGSTLATTNNGQGGSTTNYSIDTATGVLHVMSPGSSGKQPGDVESFGVRETLAGAVNSPRDSFVTVTYT